MRCVVVMKTYFWEFFGPSAGETARHFEQHLRQFLETHALRAEESGLLESEAQALVFCSAEAQVGEAIVGALRPRQEVVGGLPEELAALRAR